MPEDTIITNGAGNYTVWVHRFYQHRAYRTQLAPTSGSMGYGVPAAVAAKCVHSDRPVVSISGDGCFLMAAQELATCAYEKLNIIHLVVNNGMYGTIRMHQERTYPTRVIGTDLGNPDFVAYAAAFGIPGEVVERTQDFPVTLAHARASKTDILLN
ncbi:thiamine pyrophosphate-dependent enzyme [Pseudovibrio axinellae]